MLLFVSIWNREDTKGNDKGKTEQDTKWGWDSFVWGSVSSVSYLYPRPHGKPFLGGILPKYVSGMLVWSGLTAKSFFMLQRTALRNRRGEGYHRKMREFNSFGRFLYCRKLLYNLRIWSRHAHKRIKFKYFLIARSKSEESFSTSLSFKRHCGSEFCLTNVRNTN